MEGTLRITLDGETHDLEPGGYAFLPPGAAWTSHTTGDAARPVPLDPQGLPAASMASTCRPRSSRTSATSAGIEMPGTKGAWTTQRFVDPTDLRHDMHVNIVNFEPGGAIPFPETHVMEHGIYVLEGKAVYLLNQDWVEVQEGDFMWLRAFCPQACYAGGPGRFRYLLYKDVNRHVPLTRQFS